MKKFLKFSASVKLAVPIIIALAALIAAGTIIEAKYNAEIASKLVYRTPWMFLVLGLLCYNLIMVMVDRWPWKRRHVSFILAHIGILVLLLGSWITMEYGLDGSLRVPVGDKNRWVSLSNTDLVLWSSFDGDRMTKLADQEVDFFMRPPQKYPVSLTTDAGPIKVTDYKPFVLPSKHIVASERERAGAAIRFQINNPHVNVIEWLRQDRPGEFVSHHFGPASIHMGVPPPGRPPMGNEIFMNVLPNGDVEYHQFVKNDPNPKKKGVIKEGSGFSTGWMGLEFKILRVIPKAEEVWEFKELSGPTEVSTSALEVEFLGNKRWMQRNDMLRFFTDKGVYILTYGSRRVDLGFDVFVKKFEVGRYQGTMRAASYQSLVEIPGGGGEHVISMNEPLKYQGKTIYQASFEDGQNGGPPVASIFSINQDPGRWLKYLGSLIISLGIVYLFYDRRKAARAMAPKGNLS